MENEVQKTVEEIEKLIKEKIEYFKKLAKLNRNDANSYAQYSHKVKGLEEAIGCIREVTFDKLN